jgi:hypothetical protein
MQLDRPRFRQDLVAEPIEDGPSKFIDVMDPDSGNVFRFYEVEYSLACSMDGERDVPGIMRWAQEELGLSTSAAEVKSVIATLGELGYLDAGAAPVAKPAPTTAKPSIWDPPASATQSPQDDMLGRGVVVGQKRASTPVPDMELGNAGSSSPGHEPAAKAQNIELATGVTTGRQAPQQARGKVDDIALGVPGRVDVSVDLSDQVAISTKDVKEAVRASKVMNAVELPDELKNALETADAPPTAKQQRKPPPTPAKGMPAVDPKAAERVVEAQKQADTAKAEAGKAAEAARQADVAKVAAAKAAEAAKAAAKPLPKQPEAKKQPEARPAIAPPAPEMKANRTLVIALLVVAVAAAVFFVYKYALKKSSTETTDTMPVTPVPAPKPPAPPAPESEKIEASAPNSESIKPVAAGTVEMVAGPGDAKVKEGDALVRFAGAKALDTEISALDKDIEQRVKTELFKAQQERDAAVAAGDKAAQTAGDKKVADRQKSLDDKQAKLAAKKADLDKLVIKAASAGTFTAKAKLNQKVTPTDELGMLVHAPTKMVTFKKADAGPKSRVLLVTKDGKKLSCVVASADSSGVSMTCPDDAAPAGTEVTFGGVDTSPAPVDPAMDGSGAAAGSAAAGSAAAGSAAAPASGSGASKPQPKAPAPHPIAHPQPKAPPVEKPADPTPADKPADPAPTGSGSAN